MSIRYLVLMMPSTACERAADLSFDWVLPVAENGSENTALVKLDV